MTGAFRAMMLAGSALILAGGLAGCSDPAPETPAIENDAFDEEAAPPAELNTDVRYDPAPAMVENLSAVAPPPVEALPPPPPVEPDQQVLDDASATGMTSRSTRRDSMDDTAPADATTENRQGE